MELSPDYWGAASEQHAAYTGKTTRLGRSTIAGNDMTCGVFHFVSPYFDYPDNLTMLSSRTLVSVQVSQDLQVSLFGNDSMSYSPKLQYQTVPSAKNIKYYQENRNHPAFEIDHSQCKNGRSGTIYFSPQYPGLVTSSLSLLSQKERPTRVGVFLTGLLGGGTLYPEDNWGNQFGMLHHTPDETELMIALAQSNPYGECLVMASVIPEKMQS